MPGRIPESDGSDAVRGARHGRRLTVGVIVMLVVGGALYAQFRGSETTRSMLPDASPTAPDVNDSLARAPIGTRVTVRVLNTTTTRGLARRATLALRAFGYDVVDYDSDAKRRGSGTRIIAHTGQKDIAKRLQRALGAGVIDSAAADGSRYVDFTVLLGSDWQAPAQPFRP